MNQNVTDVWQLYQIGKDYNTQIALNETVNKNTEFYIGNQWIGVKANGLDKPVFNILKRGIDFFIAAIMSQDIKLQFVPELINDINPNDEEKEVLSIAKLIEKHTEDIWEKNKMHNMFRGILLDAANSGDGCIYTFWNNDIDLGIPKMDGVTLDNIKGDIENQRVDNVNVYFGNPNDARINHRGKPVQPYIVIAFRQLVKNTIEEAKKYNGDYKMIASDLDNEEQIGQYGKIELDGSHNETAKCTVLLKLYPKTIDGITTIYATKSSKFGYIRKEWDTKLSIYPVGWMNWSERKNSYHGQAVASSIIPNQIFINKSFAMLMLWMKQMAIPKVVFDRTRISAWSNIVGQAIGVDGDINSVASNLSPSQISNGVFTLMDNIIQYTKEFIGMPDVLLGQIKNPENTSAIVTTTRQAEIPLENVRSNLYQIAEDIGYIWLDFMANYYGKRYITIKQDNKKVVELVDFDKLKQYKFRIKIDVGHSNYFNEADAMRTLDNLLTSERISFLQWLENYPSGRIPNKEKLIDAEKEKIREQEELTQMQGKLDTLPVEEQERLASLPDTDFESELRSIIG